MKVTDLFEQRGNTVDVAVEYELEHNTPEGDYDSKIVNIEGTVTMTTDAYGTGDSPTEYEFNVKRITDVASGKPLPEKDIPADAWEEIENMAIEKANRYR